MSTIDMEALAAGLAGGSPKRQLLLRLLQQQSQAAESGQGADRAAEAAERRRVRLLEFLEARNLEMAAACGACTCWGHPRCGVCGGRGRAGWRDADPEQFRKYIEPVLYRLGLVVEHDAPEAGSRSHNPGEANDD